MDKVWEILHSEWETDPGLVSRELLERVYKIQNKYQFETERQVPIARMRDAVNEELDNSISESDGVGE